MLAPLLHIYIFKTEKGKHIRCTSSTKFMFFFVFFYRQCTTETWGLKVKGVLNVFVYAACYNICVCKGTTNNGNVFVLQIIHFVIFIQFTHMWCSVLFTYYYIILVISDCVLYTIYTTYVFILYYIVAINMLDYKNSIWRLIHTRLLNNDMCVDYGRH
jgi:hypothetical protein